MSEVLKRWQNPRKLLIGIVIVAVLLRLITSLVFFGNEIQQLPGIFDEVSYHNLAIRVLDGHGFSFGERWWPGTAAGEPTAHWSYLYTVYLAGVYAVFGRHSLVARLLQSILAGVIMPWLLYRISYRVFAREPEKEGMFGSAAGLQRAQKISLVVAAIGAVYIYFFYYAAALITESFYISAILWTFDIAIQITQSDRVMTRHWLWLGLAMGVTVLLRQLFLLFIPFFLFWLWWAKRPKLTHLLLPLAVTIALMLPWTIRNYVAFGRVVPLNTNSGFAFFWGNHPRYGTRFISILPTRAYYEMVPPELQAAGLNEAEMDSALLGEAIDIIRADPGRYVLLSISRIPDYFKFWPSSESSLVSNISRVASFGLFLPFMLYGLALSFKRRFTSWRQRLASPVMLFYLFILVYTGVHLLTWTLIRYRIPVDAVLIVFAGWALVDLGERVMARRQATGVTAVSQ